MKDFNNTNAHYTLKNRHFILSPSVTNVLIYMIFTWTSNLELKGYKYYYTKYNNAKAYNMGIILSYNVFE